MKDYPFSRINVIGAILSLIGILIVVQMGRVQISPNGQLLREKAHVYEYETQTLVPERGNIYDRWGILLAGSKENYEVGINILEPNMSPETVASTLAQVLGLKYEDMLAIAKKEFDPKQPVYYVVENFATPEQIAQLETLKEEYQKRPSKRSLFKEEIQPNIDAISWSPHLVRTYPENSLASNIIGFFSFRGLGDAKSNFGVEQYYQNILAGNPVKVNIPVNPNSITTLPKVPPGASVVLTIDREVQDSMEQVIDRAVKNSGAVGGTLLVMNPKNGEVLAMATTPRVNLNEYWTSKEVFPEGVPFNRSISMTYEPGSIFKVLTMAAALDAGKVAPDTVFTDMGQISIGGITIMNWDRRAWGPQTMTGCMQHSLNVCLAWVATELGPSSFYSYMNAFGLSQRTGIDLAGEAYRPMSVPGDSTWSDATLGTNSFGQGIAVTPIQFASAVTALANDGKIIIPHVVKAVIENGQERPTPLTMVSQPISVETARAITEMLAVSLEEEASNALVPGYRVAGKTGTAEIPSELGYVSNLTNASFVGWGPVDDPQFLVFVWLEEPTTSPWGSVVAAPVFSEAVSKLVVLLDIPPDDIRAQLYKKD